MRVFNDPITSAAIGYLDLVLTMPVEGAARSRLLDLVKLRADYLSNRHINVELARQNAIRLVQAAASEASRRGQPIVDVASVDLAWEAMCPSFYPFC